MKQTFSFLIILVLITFPAFAQDFQDPTREPDQSVVMGGLGMTWIDGQPYTTITLAPDFAFGKFGIGIYLQFLMDNNNNFELRKDEYEDGPGILRAIRYVRYGHKYDPFYTRIGMLEMASLGNGFLMWNYNNASNYDKRKIGLVLDIDLGKVGFESVTSHLERLELVGGNLYFRPFRFFNNDIPLLRNIRIYGTYIRDHDLPASDDPAKEEDLQALGFGADWGFLNLPVLKSAIYADYGKFVDFGSGKAVGIRALIPEFIGIMALGAKFEKRFSGEKFIPNFFGPLYELNRNLDPLFLLENQKKREGYFGELAGHIIHRVRLIGSYQRLNNVKRSGIIHLEALAPDLVPKIELRAYYDKANIETFEDFRTLDIYSVATVEVGYRLNMFMVLSTVYRWYWIEDEKGIFKPVERVEPRISFSYRF